MKIRELLPVANFIATPVAERIEHYREAQQNTIFDEILRPFLVPGTDQFALNWYGKDETKKEMKAKVVEMLAGKDVVRNKLHASNRV